MELRGFPPNDPLYVLVSKAFDALQHLGMHLHYMTCDGVGEPPRKEHGEPPAPVGPDSGDGA